ncbi:MAG: hypothetical protein ACRYHQ_19875 [Janthinobacterium lividum]
MQLDLVEYIIGMSGGLDRPAGSDRMPEGSPCVHFEHTPPVHPIAEAGSCVQNEHIAPTRPVRVMSAHRLLFCLAMLGWGERELARQLRRNQTSVRRWTNGTTVIPENVAAWLENLVAFHQAHPAPRRQRTAAAFPGRPALALT